MYFLTFKPSQDEIWWNTFKIYRMLNYLFKSACEGNFQEFKTFLGKFVPTSDFDPYFNRGMINIVSLKQQEMTYLFTAFGICENANPKLTVTDQPVRIIPMLNMVIVCLNELICGGNRHNIEIMLQSSNSSCFRIFTRKIDDLNSTFYDLKSNVLIL